MPNDQSPAETLFHYTSQEGLLGILGSKVLWATHILYLNDRKEFWQAFDVAITQIEESATQTGDPEEKALLERTKRKVLQPNSEAAYVASFSEDGDSLSQWRGYGGDGNGFSIGFSRVELEELAKLGGWRLNRCIYDEMTQSRKISELLDLMTDPEANVPPRRIRADGVEEIYVMLPEDKFSINLSLLAPLLKNNAFSEEMEWRLSVVEGMIFHPHHRAGQSMLIPYCQFPLSENGGLTCIKHITIGPGPHAELSQKSLNSYLRSIGCGHISIRLSEVPYRTW